MKRNILKFIIALIFFAAGNIFAGNVTIKASVSSNPVAINANFRYSVEISGNSTSLPSVKFPDLSNFYILSGPNTSTNMQWINGKMSSSKTYSFILKPKKLGEVTISGATAKADGKTISSNVIRLKVVKGSSAPSANKAKTAKNVNDPTVSGNRVFMKTSVSKRKAYLGEEIDVEYKLYFNVSIRSYNLESVPANAGFWNEDFEMPRQPAIHSEIVNGVNYNVAVIRKTALFPTRTGKLTIEPITVTLETVVRAKRNRRNSFFDNFFDDPFNTRTIKKTLSSKPVSVNVQAPPKENKPADFNGAVGRYNFSVTVDKNSVNVNEAVSLKIKLSGVGNIKLIELPKPIVPPDMEQYEPKINSSIKRNGNKISGSKTAEYILIPRLGGDYTIKPLSFSYFSPKDKKYVTLRSEPLSIKVSGKGTAVSNPLSMGNALNRTEVTLLGSDIRFIKNERSAFRRIGAKPYLSSVFWGNIFSALLLFLLIFIYYEKKSKLESNIKLAKSKKAGKIAAKTLAKAKKILSSGKDTEYFKAISAALRGFVQDKLFIDLTDFTMPKVNKALKEKGIPADQVDEYISVLEESDFKQYANVGSTLEEKQELFEKAKSILTKLEKWI
jgi:hypothetical protein